MSRDNWGRLVVAVLRREELREIARAPSIAPSELSSRLSFSSISSDLDSDFSFRVASPPHELAPVSRPNATNENHSGVSTGSSFVDWIIPKRRLAKLKEKFFRENGGLLLEQISRDHGANETTKLFSLRDLKRATNSFNEGTIVGQGSTGTVYKGILKDNLVIIVKKSEPMRNVEQFINEVIIVSQIRHRNLVRLLGCCLETEVPLLVYEFIRNGTLYSHIHGRILSSEFSWEMRIKVAAETAAALEFLHSGAPIPIVHGTITSSNILLDQNYTVKVSDFHIGVSRFDSLDASEITTIRQSGYYCDPEYFLSGRMTKKSDVYSFGVVLVELLTNQKVLSYDRGEEQRHIAQYFVSAIQEDRLLQILDSNLVREDRIEQLERFVKLIAWCLKLKGEDRPTMEQVAMELEALRSGVEIELEAPRPGENPQWTEKDVDEEEMMDYLSNPTTPSNSNDGFLLQHNKLLKDSVANEKITIFASEDLQMATDNYDEENIIGRGGYATVYKGSLTNYGVVAVKKLSMIYQGQIEKYINEVKILSQINHQNVVKILGCCLDSEVPLLVFEFITNGTLFSHLHDPSLASSFSWEMRIKVAAETAEALAYLHEVQIIHRDIKTANILIDQSYTAKVSDFGGSRFNPDEGLELSEVVQGTLGYLDPEYLYLGQLTEKSDVYSFGVVLAELLTAKVALSPDRPKEYRTLALYFLNAIQEDRLVEILDSNLVREDRIEQLKRFAKLTEWCLKSKQEERPSMNEVAMELQALRSEAKHPQDGRFEFEISKV